jgi:transcription antitermination factor NusG
MPWHAIQTLSTREQQVAAELTRIQIPNYLPSYQEKRRWSDRDRILDIPLFRGYLFAEIPRLPGRWDEENWPPAAFVHHTVLKIVGCMRIVGGVTEAEIEAVRLMMANGARPLDPLDKVRRLPKGRLVRVKCGPLTGMEGTLIRHKGKDRIMVSLATIQRALATEINIRDVQILERAEAA